MAQKAISLTGQAQIVECEPEALNDKLVEELKDLVLRVEKQEEANSQSEPANFFYRVHLPEYGTTLTSSGWKDR